LNRSLAGSFFSNPLTVASIIAVRKSRLAAALSPDFLVLMLPSILRVSTLDYKLRQAARMAGITLVSVRPIADQKHIFTPFPCRCESAARCSQHNDPRPHVI
jgi:hypothetical protein